MYSHKQYKIVQQELCICLFPWSPFQNCQCMENSVLCLQNSFSGREILFIVLKAQNSLRGVFLNVCVSLKASFEHLPLPYGLIFLHLLLYNFNFMKKIWHLNFQTFIYTLFFEFCFFSGVCVVFYIFTMVYFYQRNIRWPIALNSAISLWKTSGPDSLIFFLFFCFFVVICGLIKRLFVLLVGKFL